MVEVQTGPRYAYITIRGTVVSDIILISLYPLCVYLAQPHMNIRTGGHYLILGRSIVRNTGRRRDERDIMITSEKEWD
jgi:hypothetical protein